MTEERNENQRGLDDLLAAYELGLLSAEERAACEAHLLRDEESLVELYEMAPFAAALTEDPARYHRAVHTALAETTPSFLTRLRSYLAELMTPRVLIPVATVAVVAVLLSVPREGVVDLRSLAVVEPIPYVQLDTRSGTPDADRLFTAAMAHYTEGRYDEAVLGLQEAVQTASSEVGDRFLDQARLYLGMSLLLADRPEEAIAPLTTATHSLVLPLAERSRWYLAQARLLTNAPAEAHALLDGLAGQSRVYGEQATWQLNRLERMLPHH